MTLRGRTAVVGIGEVPDRSSVWRLGNFALGSWQGSCDLQVLELSKDISPVRLYSTNMKDLEL